MDTIAATGTINSINEQIPETAVRTKTQHCYLKVEY